MRDEPVRSVREAHEALADAEQHIRVLRDWMHGRGSAVVSTHGEAAEQAELAAGCLREIARWEQAFEEGSS